jgi:hypothetical protein
MNRPDLMALLLLKGADPHLKNVHEKTPKDDASKQCKDVLQTIATKDWQALKQQYPLAYEYKSMLDDY